MFVPFPSPPLIFSILLPGCHVPLGFLGFWIPSTAQLQSSNEETQVLQMEPGADGRKRAQKTSHPQGEEEDSSVFYPLEEGLELPNRTHSPTPEHPQRTLQKYLLPLTQKFGTTLHPCLYEKKAEAGSLQAGHHLWKTMCSSYLHRFPGPSQPETGKMKFWPKTTASLNPSSWSSKYRQPKIKTKHKSRLRIWKSRSFPTL